MNRHTPAPWVHNNLGMIVDRENMRIATIDSQIENANLISAAPEMYKCLIDVLLCFSNDLQHFPNLKNAISNTIAKAEGKS